MTQEQIERMWFRRIAGVLMAGLILSGLIPVMKDAFFPRERNYAPVASNPPAVAR